MLFIWSKIGINFNPSESKYQCTNVFSSDIEVNFDLSGLLLENFKDSFVYLGVKLKIFKGMLNADSD